MKFSLRNSLVFSALLFAFGSATAVADEPAAQMLDSSFVSLTACQSDVDVCRPAPRCAPPWAHRCGAFGELLFLRARDSEVAFALPVDGNVPRGTVGVLDPEFDLGFRLGLTHALDDCRSIVGTYTGFFSEVDRTADVAAGLSLSKLLVHPNELNAAANALTSFGSYDVEFQTFDLDYRFLLHGSDCTAANLSIGARYGHLEEQLNVVYTNAGLTETVSSDIDFDGLGLRLGADIEHHVGRGLYGYGKTNANFLAGEFDASYLHSSNVDPVRVTTAWEAARLVTVLELEVGAGWQPTSDLRLSAGYTLSTWLGAVKTDDWINGVRNNGTNFRDMSDDLTFDGFILRAEYRF